MSAFQQCICVLMSIFVVKCQPERFYFFGFDDGESISSDWVVHNDVYPLGSPLCPRWKAGLQLSGDKSCVATSGTHGNAYLSRVISTVGYHSIHLKIDVNPLKVENNEWCYIQYRTASKEWINTNIINGDQTTVLGFDVTIPDTIEYNDQSTFEVKIGIYVDGSDYSKHCLYDYFEVIGIPYIPTANTNKPTMTPSHLPSAQPSASPSGVPSNKPSASPSDAPSNKPSASPSDAPSNKPSAPSYRPTTQPHRKPTRYITALPTTAPIAATSLFTERTLPNASRPGTTFTVNNTTESPSSMLDPNVMLITICFVVIAISCCSCCGTFLYCRYLKKEKREKPEHTMINMQMERAHKIHHIVPQDVGFESEIVASWLRNNVRLPQYIGHDDLRELGIKKLGHRTFILGKIKLLRNTQFMVKGITRGVDRNKTNGSGLSSYLDIDGNEITLAKELPPPDDSDSDSNGQFGEQNEEYMNYTVEGDELDVRN
eukprot:40717_1